MANLPSQMKKDAIAEAILELRFDCSLSAKVPEIVVAKLAENPRWASFETVRLPVSEIPATLRAQDAKLRFQALLELRSQQEKLIAKIGANVVSIHFLAPYPGGEFFQKEMNRLVDFIFDNLDGLSISRLGLRYINLFSEQDHKVKKVSDLAVDVAVADVCLAGPINVNYLIGKDADSTLMVRIASPEFVDGMKQGFSALVDVDVYTRGGFLTAEKEQVKKWISAARRYEKEEFFKLFTDRMKQDLIEAYEE